PRARPPSPPPSSPTRRSSDLTETEDRTYDRAGRLTAVTSSKAGTTVTKTAHTLSPAGLPTHVDITRADVGTTGYDLTYDTAGRLDRKSTRLNSSHVKISYAVF